MKTWTATSTGRSVTLRSVPFRYVAQIAQREDLQDPDPPTFPVTLAGGIEKDFPHDPTTLETPEDKATWAEYERGRAIARARRTMEIARFLFYECVIEDPEPVEQWAFDFDLWGLAPPDPEDKVDFKVRWLEEEICGGDEEDTASLLLACYSVSGMDQEVLKKIESFFRPNLAREGPE